MCSSSWVMEDTFLFTTFRDCSRCQMILQVQVTWWNTCFWLANLYLFTLKSTWQCFHVDNCLLFAISFSLDCWNLSFFVNLAMPPLNATLKTAGDVHTLKTAGIVHNFVSWFRDDLDPSGILHASSSRKGLILHLHSLNHWKKSIESTTTHLLQVCSG